MTKDFSRENSVSPQAHEVNNQQFAGQFFGRVAIDPISNEDIEARFPRGLRGNVVLNHEDDCWALPILSAATLNDPLFPQEADMSVTRIFESLKTNQKLAAKLINNTLPLRVREIELISSSYSRTGRKKEQGLKDPARAVLRARLDEPSAKELIGQFIDLRAALGVPTSERQKKYGANARMTWFNIAEVRGERPIMENRATKGLLAESVSWLVGSYVFGPTSFHNL